MQKKLAITALISALFTGGAYAQQFDEKYYTVDESSVKIEQLNDRGGSIGYNGYNGPVINPPIPNNGQLPKPPEGPGINPPIGGFDPASTINTIDSIVNLVDKIWSIIDKNRPVVDIATNYANAVPFGTTHWSQLQGWSKPSTRKYTFSMKNLYGAEVVKVIYQVHWTHSGNFQGKGKFLTGVTVEPLSVVTSWGYKVNLVSEVPDSTIANVGTHEDPVASMQVQLKWIVNTSLKDISSKVIYYVQGDGLIQEIGVPFEKGLQERADRRSAELSRKLENVKFN